MPASRARLIIVQASNDAGLVHRDLKPANVLLAEDGPRVIDFGISGTLRERGHELPGARSVLTAFQSSLGIVQSVLTGNIRPNAVTKLSVFGLDGYIDFEVGGYGSDEGGARVIAVATGTDKCGGTAG